MEGEKIFKKYRNSGCIQTESVKIYLLAVAEDVGLDKTRCVKMPASLSLSLKVKEVMDTVSTAVGYIRQGVKIAIVSTLCVRNRFGT
jgi:hypothetical protein